MNCKRELCLFWVEAFCSNVDVQMQAATGCQEAHFPYLFILSELDVEYDCCFMQPYLSDTYPK